MTSPKPPCASIFLSACIFVIHIHFHMPAYLFHVPRRSHADDTARKMREAEAHFSRGEYLEALGDYQEVIEQAKKGEHQPKALMMSAAIYGTFLKDHEAALNLYSQIRAKYPGSIYEADALFQAAMIQYERARYREASRLFALYIEKFPTGSRRDVASFMRDASDHPPSERERREREQAARLEED